MIADAGTAPVEGHPAQVRPGRRGRGVRIVSTDVIPRNTGKMGRGYPRRVHVYVPVVRGWV